jgi:dihydropteroate synthase
MLSLESLAALYEQFGDLANTEVAPIVIGDRKFPSQGPPVIMGTVNLSRDSTYRESIAISTHSAIRKASIMTAQGAHLIDIGAESSTAKAIRVSAQDQANLLVPIIEELSDMGIAISAETYEPLVVKACLEAGASVLNFTGTAHQEEILELAGAAHASVILCYVGGANVREITDLEIDQDPLPGLLDYFAERIDIAKKCGVTNIIIDPGMSQQGCGTLWGALAECRGGDNRQTRPPVWQNRQTVGPLRGEVTATVYQLCDCFHVAPWSIIVGQSWQGLGIFGKGSGQLHVP